MKGVRQSGDVLALLALLERLQSGTDATSWRGGQGKNTGTPGTVTGRGVADLTEGPISH